MRICVTGGAGFIGSHVVHRFVRAGHDVLAIDNFDFSYGAPYGAAYAKNISYRFDELIPTVRLERCDLTEGARLASLLGRFQPDCIVHLACLPLVSTATRNLELARTSMMTGLLQLLEIASALPSLGRLVYVSSSMVYGDFAEDPMPESGPTVPVNVYGGLKLAGEIAAKTYLRQAGTEVVIVRPSAVYGPGDVHGRVVQLFCQQAIAGERLRIANGRDVAMDFTFVDDIADGLCLAATHPAAAGETFNMTRGEAHSLVDLAMMIRSRLPGTTFEIADERADDRPRRGALSIDKARLLLGYAPKWPLRRGLDRYLGFLGAQPQLARV